MTRASGTQEDKRPHISPVVWPPGRGVAGKAERVIQKLLRGWAYARSYGTSAIRRRGARSALLGWFGKAKVGLVRCLGNPPIARASEEQGIPPSVVLRPPPPVLQHP